MWTPSQIFLWKEEIRGLTLEGGENKKHFEHSTGNISMIIRKSEFD